MPGPATTQRQSSSLTQALQSKTANHRRTTFKVQLHRSSDELWGFAWDCQALLSQRLVIAGLDPHSSTCRNLQAGDELLNVNGLECCEEMRRELGDALKVSLLFRSAAEAPSASVDSTKPDIAKQEEIRRPPPIAPPSAFVKAKVKNTFIHISDSEEANNTSSDGTSRLAMSDPLPMSEHSRAFHSKPCHYRGAGAKIKERADPERASAHSSSSNDGRTSVAYSSNGNASCPGTDWDFPSYQPPTAEALARLQRTLVLTIAPVPFAATRTALEGNHADVDAMHQTVTPEFVSALSDDGETKPKGCASLSASDREGPRPVHSDPSDFSGRSEAGPPPKSMARVWEVWTKPDESQSSSMDESTTYASTLSGPQKKTRRGGKRMNRPCHLKAKEQSSDFNLLEADSLAEGRQCNFHPLTAAVLNSAEEQIVTADCMTSRRSSQLVCQGGVEVDAVKVLRQDKLAKPTEETPEDGQAQTSTPLNSTTSGSTLQLKCESVALAGAQAETRKAAPKADMLDIECGSGGAKHPPIPKESPSLQSRLSSEANVCGDQDPQQNNHRTAGVSKQDSKGISASPIEGEKDEVPMSLIGKSVLLQGLVRMPDFNGEWGKVLCYDAELKRFKVSVARPSGPPLLAKLLLKNLLVPSTANVDIGEDQAVDVSRCVTTPDTILTIAPTASTPPQSVTRQASKATLRRAALRKSAREKLKEACDSKETPDSNFVEDAELERCGRTLQKQSRSLSRQRPKSTTTVDSSVPHRRSSHSRPPSCSISSSNVPGGSIQGAQDSVRQVRRQQSCPARSARMSHCRASTAIAPNSALAVSSGSDELQLEVANDNSSVTGKSQTNLVKHVETDDMLGLQTVSQIEEISVATDVSNVCEGIASANKKQDVEQTCGSERRLDGLSSVSNACEKPIDVFPALDSVSSKASFKAARQCSVQKRAASAAAPRTSVRAKRISAPSSERTRAPDSVHSTVEKVVDSLKAQANRSAINDKTNITISAESSVIDNSTTEITSQTGTTKVGAVRRKWKRHEAGNETPMVSTAWHEEQNDRDLPLPTTEIDLQEKQVDAHSNASATKWRPSLRLREWRK